MDDIGFSMTISYAEDLSEDEYLLAEELIQILYEAFERFEKEVYKSGMMLIGSGVGVKVAGSEFIEWYDEYQNTTYEQCDICGELKKLKELVLRNTRKGSYSNILVCDECRM